MRRGSKRRFFQRAIPVGMIDVDVADLDAMVARVADQLRRRVKAHRLGVQDRRAEDVGIEGLEPAGGIDQQSEGGGVAFRKAVFAEPFDLLEAALGEFLSDSRSATMPSIIRCAIVADRAGALEGRHGAAQLVGLAGREAAGVDGDLHRLLLEQRHAERLLEDRFKFRAWDIRPSPCPVAGADRDAPCRPGSDRAGRSPPR